MSDKKFTPAPWVVRYFKASKPEQGFFVEAKNNNMPQLGYGIEILQDDFGDHNGYPTEQRIADANLIAAAPYMYDLLERIINTPAKQLTSIESIQSEAEHLLNKINQ